MWDLRKQKSITTMENEGMEVDCLSFCPIGKYFAYGTSAGDIILTVVKDWDTKVVLKDGKGGTSKVTGVAWGAGAASLIATHDSSRVVKFWGTQG